MADTQDNLLVDESAFPLRSVLGKPLDYDDLLNKDLLELLGLGNASEEERQTLYAKILQTVENRVLARLADLLTDEEMEQATSITDKEQLASFFEQKQIDIPRFFAEEALLYKSELVSLINRDTNS